MRTLRIFFLLPLLFVALGCSKEENLKEFTGSVSGRLVYEKPGSNENPLPGVKSRKIRVFDTDAYQTNKLDHLYDILTDAEGYFSMQGLQHGKKYTMVFKDTIQGVLYSVEDNLPQLDIFKEEGKLKGVLLKANFDSSTQNQVEILTKDVNGRIVPEVELWLYKDVGTRDEDTGGVFKLKALKTDVNGKFSGFGFGDGRYYYRAKKVFLGKKVEAMDEFTIQKGGKYSIPVALKNPPATVENGIDITIIDPLENPKNSIQVALYNSKSLIETFDSTTTAIGLKITDINGVAKFRKLPVRLLYIRIGLGDSCLIDTIQVTTAIKSKKFIYKGR